jgi:D-tyrosyl-tRNA(Tyr) deacylase
MMSLKMRAVIQRVTRAEVRVEGQVIGSINRGLLLLVAFSTNDTPASVHALAEKIVGLRVFDNDLGRIDRSIVENGGGLLVVSQFTLYGDCRKGRRPSYTRAAAPENALPLYQAFLDSLRALLRGHDVKLSQGRFQSMMEVESVNDGPVTLLLDSDRVF